MRVYLSGPITGIENYEENFSKAAEYVEHLGGISAINPAQANIGNADWDWADLMVRDLALLRGADVLVSLPGWENSHGARVEREFALGLGLPVADLGDFRASLAEIQNWRARKAG